MKSGSKITMILLSTAALLNVMFMPIFELFGGILPENPRDNLFTVIELLLDDFNNWDYWVVQFTVLIFIPTLFMFIFSLIGSKGLCVASSSVGLFLLVYKMIDYVAYCEDIEYLLNFDDTCVSIGTWIALLIFFVGFIVSLCSVRKINQNPAQCYQTAYQYSSTCQTNPMQFNEQQPYAPVLHNNTRFVENSLYQNQGDSEKLQPVVEDSKPQVLFCRNCGTKINPSHKFCSKCGFKF